MREKRKKHYWNFITYKVKLILLLFLKISVRVAMELGQNSDKGNAMSLILIRHISFVPNCLLLQGLKVHPQTPSHTICCSKLVVSSEQSQCDSGDSFEQKRLFFLSRVIHFLISKQNKTLGLNIMVDLRFLVERGQKCHLSSF